MRRIEVINGGCGKESGGSGGIELVGNIKLQEE